MASGPGPARLAHCFPPHSRLPRLPTPPFLMGRFLCYLTLGMSVKLFVFPVWIDSFVKIITKEPLFVYLSDCENMKVGGHRGGENLGEFGGKNMFETIV